MLGLFGSLNMAARSLATQQEGTAVAGQNMANVNNPGYARQILNVESSTPLPTAIGEEGTGVDAVSITEVRSAILDNQIQSENSATSSFSAQQSALQSAEAYLGEQLTSTSSSATSSPNGLASDLSNLLNSFQSLSLSPTDLTLRQTVVQSAQQVATQFNQVAANLTQLRSGLNSSIQNDVAAANQDLSDIAALNQQIMVATGGGGTANDLVDLRQQKIEDLASKVNITATAQTNGGVDISVGGVAMVSGVKAVNGLQTYDAGGGKILVEDQNSATPVAITGGSVGGNITARDGALASLQSSLDNLANQFVTVVNAYYSKGYDLHGGTGKGLFTGNTAATIGVDPVVSADPSYFQAGNGGGAGDNTIALQLANLPNLTLPGLNNQTVTGSYAQTVAALGTAVASATNQLNTSSAVSTMLTNQRSSASGVSIDQEMTNLMQYQKAYEASAQIITTLNEMLQTLNQMKTV